MSGIEIIIIVYIVIDLVILAAIGYALTVIKPLYPAWYRRHICDIDKNLWGDR